MSDEFDREAEREKLREKYEQDQAEREASERMSELLLQGATMTNRHCPECHSPVFSYEGTEFCPTCQREVTEEGELAGAAGDTPDAEAAGDVGANGGTAADPGEQKTTAGESGAAAEPEAPDSAPDAAEPEPEAPDSAPAEKPRAHEPRQPREETRPAPAREQRPARVDPPARREEPTADRAGAERGGLDDAEAALVREITNLTRRAEETRDVGRKREFFAAAREAAETLETVRRL